MLRPAAGEAPGSGSREAPPVSGPFGLRSRFGPASTVLLLAFAVAVMLSSRPSGPSLPLWGLVGVEVALPIWWSRDRSTPPAWSLGLFLAAAAALVAADPHSSSALVLVVIGTALAILRLPDRPAIAVAAISLAVGVLSGLRQRVEFGGNSGLLSVGAAYAVAYGALIASRQRMRHQWETERLLADLQDEHRRLEAAHAQLAQHAQDMAELAASEERNRIAREIHDVLAHALTVIIVQAEAAAVRLRTDPPGAADQVRTVAGLARQALQEARLSVAAIRADPGAAGLDSLRRLCQDATRLSGMRCDLSAEGEERPLPAPVALAAYRILQEALTNARRHGQAERVQVGVAFSARALTLTITDDGRAADTAEAVPGSGLRGMRERAQGIGGSLSAGPLPGHAGFCVRAELPLPEDAGREPEVAARTEGGAP